MEFKIHNDAEYYACLMLLLPELFCRDYADPDAIKVYDSWDDETKNYIKKIMKKEN